MVQAERSVPSGTSRSSQPFRPPVAVKAARFQAVAQIRTPRVSVHSWADSDPVLGVLLTSGVVSGFGAGGAVRRWKSGRDDGGTGPTAGRASRLIWLSPDR